MSEPRGARTEPVPFHRTPDPPQPFARRLLLVSGHFPPSRAVGGLRWQKMSQFAAERGWGTDVICLDPAGLDGTDPERLRDLPLGMRVYGVPHDGPGPRALLEPLVRLARRAEAPTRSAGGDGTVANGAAANGGVARRDIPRLRPWSPRDVAKGLFSLRWLYGDRQWAHRAAAVGRAIWSPTHRVVVSSGPPHFAHEAGRLIARDVGAPHVVDFRDPWSLAERFAMGVATPMFVSAIEWYERRIVSGAALVVANTELAAGALRAAHPRVAERVVTIMNGSDDEVRPDVPADPRFLVAYAGAIYYDRDPRLLFRAAARVIAELGLTPAQIGLEFMGPVDTMSTPVAEQARAEGIADYVRHHPPGSRAASARFLASASLLVSLPQDTETAIPSKLFEYAMYDAWMLNLAKSDSASALVLRGTTADVVEPTDVAGMAEVLRRRYLEFAAGTRPVAVAGDGRFSRARQAEPLLEAIEGIAPIFGTSAGPTVTRSSSAS